MFTKPVLAVLATSPAVATSNGDAAVPIDPRVEVNVICPPLDESGLVPLVLILPFATTVSVPDVGPEELPTEEFVKVNPV